MSRVDEGKQAAQDQARKDQFTGMITNQMNKIPLDYTPQQKAAITSADLGGLDVNYGNLRDEMMRRAGATGSFAGIPESLSAANREAAQAKAQAGATEAKMFADTPVQRALQQASIFEPALSGMLYPTRYPSGQQSTLNSIIGAGGALGAAAIMQCYVAAELFGGWASVDTQTIRLWLSKTRYMKPFFIIYKRVSSAWANYIRRHKLARRITKKLFDHFLARARKDKELSWLF